MMAYLRVWRPTRRPLEFFHRIPLDESHTGCGQFLVPSYGWFTTVAEAEEDACKPCPGCFGGAR